MGSIQGSLWHDANGNEVREASESTLQGWTIYLDANRNGARDDGELFATTNASGDYRIDNVPAGEHLAVQEPQAGWEQTVPHRGSYVMRTIALAAGEQRTGINFANRETTHVFTPTIDGTVPAFDQAGLIDTSSDALRASNETVAAIEFDFSSIDPSLRIVSAVLEFSFADPPPYPIEIVCGVSTGDGAITRSDLTGRWSFQSNMTTEGRQELRLDAEKLQEHLQEGAKIVFTLWHGRTSYSIHSTEASDSALRPTLRIATTAADTGTIVGRVEQRIYADPRKGIGPGFEGWNVFLDENANGILDAEERTARTDAKGDYSFTGLAAGYYSVKLIPASGWKDAALPSSWPIFVARNATVERNFGVRRIGVQTDVFLAIDDATSMKHLKGWIKVDDGPCNFVLRYINPDSSEQRAVLEFDLSRLNASLPIVAATLQLPVAGLFTHGQEPSDRISEFDVFAYHGDGVVAEDDGYQALTRVGSGSVDSEGGNCYVPLDLGVLNTLLKEGKMLGLVVAMRDPDRDGFSIFGLGQEAAVYYQPVLIFEQEAPPSVTINRAARQPDPTAGTTVRFDAVFNEPVTDFGPEDVVVSGTAPGQKSIRVTGSGSTYQVIVSGITGNGTVVAQVAAGGVQDSAGNKNFASTSTDNSVMVSAWHSTVGVYVPGSATFYLKNSLTGGNADVAFNYGGAHWVPLMGDWDGDGVDTPGVYVLGSSTFYLRNSNTGGYGDVGFNFGDPSWFPRTRFGIVRGTPLVGDWDGDGKDTVGLYVPSTGMFYLRDSNSAGPADLAFNYGAPNWTPIVGDWDGDGKDTIGVYVPASGTFYLKNSLAGGYADIGFIYGCANWTPIAGDWNGDGKDTIGVYVPGSATFYLKNSLTGGYADIGFNYGAPNWKPLAGDWNGPAVASLMALVAAIPGQAVAPLTTADAQAMLSAAGERWQGAAALIALDDVLAKARIVVTDLPAGILGQAVGDTIFLDDDAAGHGWFIDPSPSLDEEFEPLGNTGTLRAVDPRAVDRIDLLSVVEYELGHLAGLADLEDLGSVMGRLLAPGVRRKALA